MTSAGEDEDFKQLNIHSLTPQAQACGRAFGGLHFYLKMQKGHLQSQCLVCLFWAPVETWQCDTVDSVEIDLLPL